MRFIASAALAAAVLLLSPQAAAAQDSSNVRVDNESTAFIKPCFAFEPGGPWVNFGGIGPGGSFMWTDFMSIIEAARGVPAGSLSSAVVQFTYTDFFSGVCPAADEAVPGSVKTTFQIDRETNYTIQIGKKLRGITLKEPGE